LCEEPVSPVNATTEGVTTTDPVNATTAVVTTTDPVIIQDIMDAALNDDLTVDELESAGLIPENLLSDADMNDVKAALIDADPKNGEEMINALNAVAYRAWCQFITPSIWESAGFSGSSQLLIDVVKQDNLVVDAQDLANDGLKISSIQLSSSLLTVVNGVLGVGTYGAACGVPLDCVENEASYGVVKLESNSLVECA
jgi:hypothetical protein